MKEKDKILELTIRLKANDIDFSNLVYMPLVPMVGQHEFVIEEWYGMKVARLISSSHD